MNYIILEMGKVYISYKNKKREYFIEKNNRLYSPTNEEYKYINSLFSNALGYIYEDDKLLQLIDKNNNIKDGDKDFTSKFIMLLNDFIPYSARDNLYRNIKDLRFNFSFSDIFYDKVSSIINGDIYSNGNYDTYTNSINLSKSYLEFIKSVSIKKNNPERFYNLEIERLLVHEFAHMASSNFDFKSGISLCGFDKYPALEERDKNRGLTEGMSEIISFLGVPGTVEIYSGYYIECLLIQQLIQIIGLDVVLYSYFGNKGTLLMEEKLEDIINDKNKSYELFRKIEDNFFIRGINGRQTLLASIQNDLIEYFDKKLESLHGNIDYCEEVKLINNYQKFLIDFVTLSKMIKDPSNYIGLKDTLVKFYCMKMKYLDDVYMDDIVRKK